MIAHPEVTDKLLAQCTKVYKGVRPPAGPRVVVQDGPSTGSGCRPVSYFLPVPKDITAYDWGRSGTGPAYLAAALIGDALPWLTEESRRWYAECFYQDVICHLPRTWRLEQRGILAWWRAERREENEVLWRKIAEVAQ